MGCFLDFQLSRFGVGEVDCAGFEPKVLHFLGIKLLDVLHHSSHTSLVIFRWLPGVWRLEDEVEASSLFLWNNAIPTVENLDCLSGFFGFARNLGGESCDGQGKKAEAYGEEIALSLNYPSKETRLFPVVNRDTFEVADDYFLSADCQVSPGRAGADFEFIDKFKLLGIRLD